MTVVKENGTLRLVSGDGEDRIEDQVEVQEVVASLSEGSNNSTPDEVKNQPPTHDHQNLEYKYTPNNITDAIFEIILEILIHSSVMNILASQFPTLRNCVAVAFIVGLVILVLEGFQGIFKKSREFLKKKMAIFFLLSIGFAYMVNAAVSKMVVGDPGITWSNLFLQSLNFSEKNDSTQSENDVMRYIMSVDVFFVAFFSMCILSFQVFKSI